MAALVAGMARAGADVIGIEQIGVIGMEGLVARRVLAEQKLLEKPGGVGAVPFGRTRIRHRLDQLIFRRQRRGTALGLATDRQEGFHQLLGESAGIGEG